jgi:hypothetical protein
MVLLATAYRVVFDVTQDPNANLTRTIWWIALSLMALGILLLAFRRRLPQPPIIIPALLAFLGLIGTIVLTVRRHSDLAEALRSGRCQVTEGIVTEFHPMPAGGHAFESFSVSGKHFQYSDWIITPGLHQSSTYGGPIREGMRVRIHHLDNDIAKVESAEDAPPI